MLPTIRPLVFCLLFPLLLDAATKERNWKAGKITADSSISGNAYTNVAAVSRHPAIDPHILIIQGDDSLYTAQEKHPWSGWCLLIQGEEIKYAEDNHGLSVVDADGQKCRLAILSRQQRSSH